jgi:hypothetical protein
MLLKKKFFIFKNKSFTDFLLKKQFAKYVYTKFLICKTVSFAKKKIILLDNYLSEFNIKIKKKFRRLNFLFNLKSGNFLKSDLFIYKHSRLNFYFFISLGFKTYIKKNIYGNINNFKNLLLKSNLIFLFKSIRGGFLGFSNKIVGYLSKRNLIRSSENLFRYKKYCILQNATCVPYSLSFQKSFSYYNTGFTRNFGKSKSSFRNLIFKRFKFFFNFKKFNYIRFQQYFFLIIKFLNSKLVFNTYFYNFFFKLYKLLVK